jgi:hypothetical protein
MSAMVHRSTPEQTMNLTARQPNPRPSIAAESAADAGTMSARLRVIHDRVRSGDYRVPATAIADRMVEQMLIQRRQRS